MKILKKNSTYIDKKTGLEKPATNFKLVLDNGIQVNIKPTFKSDFFVLLQISEEEKEK